VNAKTDQELLQAYAREQSEAAFAELVHRHVHLVYSAALRLVVDPHLAEDATQGTFIALAQNARKLAGRAVLSSWLHLTVRNIAAKLVRTEMRRRAREQEAVAMELESTQTEALWHQVAPHLDEAIGFLSDKERDALMLRFFEQKSAREMAQALGVSEEAAQRRVSRAVERLRGVLAKRGVAAGASGLVLVLSAKAVQAAPAELAGAILGALAAGTAVHTVATTAAGTALLTATLQKVLLATVLVAGAGTGLYQAHQLGLQRDEAARLSRQQAVLAEQVRQLEHARDQVTNLLAAAQEENARLKSGQLQAEMLRLRSQAGALQQALATNAASAAPNLAARLWQDPDVKSQTREDMRVQWLAFFVPLFKELKLTPAQSDQAARLYAETVVKGIERVFALTPGTVSQAQLDQVEEETVAEIGRQLQPLLGEQGVAQFKQIRAELPARFTVGLLDGQVGANGLSEEQSTRLQKIIQAEPLALTTGILGQDKAFWGTPQEIEEHLANVQASNARIVQQAGSFLSPEQVSALSTVLSNGVSARLAFAAAYIQKH
jgi:RNA polymerase sigma factor (sigma-70 family)